VAYFFWGHPVQYNSVTIQVTSAIHASHTHTQITVIRPAQDTCRPTCGRFM